MNWTVIPDNPVEKAASQETGAVNWNVNGLPKELKHEQWEEPNAMCNGSGFLDWSSGGLPPAFQKVQEAAERVVPVEGNPFVSNGSFQDVRANGMDSKWLNR